MYSIKIIVCMFLFIISFFIISNVYSYTKYSIGDVVKYNDTDFYVIKNSDSKDNSITLLKKEPLTIDEVNTYGKVGTENNRVNRYTSSMGITVGTAKDINGYGGMAFHSSETCRYMNNNIILDGCPLSYDGSDIKYVVDEWKNDKLNENDLITDETGYSVRLITISDLLDNFVYKSGSYYYNVISAPDWLYNDDYSYWTMTLYSKNYLYEYYIVNNRGSILPSVIENGSVGGRINNFTASTVRPVIILKKTALGDEEEVINDSKDNVDELNTPEDNNTMIDKAELKIKVNVPNTMQKISILLIMIGVILVSISIVIVVKTKK